MDGISERSDFARTLASFEDSRSAEQATALREFQDRVEPAHRNNETAEAHSCGFCQNFRLSWSSSEPAHALNNSIDSQVFYFLSHSLSRDALLQGLKRDCLLFQWIFTLLSRTLAAFKSEVAKSGFSKMPGLGNMSKELLDVSLDERTHTLDHIKPATCIIVRIRLNERETGEGALTIEYEPDTIALKLWEDSCERMTVFEAYRPWGDTRLTGFTTLYDPITNSISARPAKSLNVEDSFRLGCEWLHECRHSHLHCGTESMRELRLLPSKVIDIGTRFPIRTIKLHWTEEGETGEYVALSYCWGGSQSLITTTATAQEFTDGIPTSKLPKTIVDAINVTHRLGLRLLWVDALCIIQDDPEDVAREISKMAQIYQEATVTVSAASARSVYDGFLHQTIHKSPSVKLPIEAGDGLEGFVYLQQSHTPSSVGDPIHLRAWTLQEHVLAQRVLVFGTQGLWWTCSSKEYSNMSNTSTHSDFNFDGINSGTRAVNRDAYESLDSWRSMVRGYTRRFLTYPRDKLPAIAGIAAHYSKRVTGAYLAGLWEFSLVSELMWRSSRSDITRPIVRRAPSWSWASVDGEVLHDWCSVSLGPRCPRVLACTVMPTSMASPFGSVIPELCVLRLEAYLDEVFWRLDQKRIYKSSESLVDIGHSQADALEAGVTGLGMVVWALLVGENPLCGLLLAKVNRDTFKRVGAFKGIFTTDTSQFERKSISII